MKYSVLAALSETSAMLSFKLSVVLEIFDRVTFTTHAFGLSN